MQQKDQFAPSGPVAAISTPPHNKSNKIGGKRMGVWVPVAWESSAR